MNTERLTAINFIVWVGRYCIYVGDGFWLYYKVFYDADQLYDKYQETLT